MHSFIHFQIVRINVQIKINFLLNKTNIVFKIQSIFATARICCEITVLFHIVLACCRHVQNVIHYANLVISRAQSHCTVSVWMSWAERPEKFHFFFHVQHYPSCGMKKAFFFRRTVHYNEKNSATFEPKVIGIAKGQSTEMNIFQCEFAYFWLN